MGRIWLGFTRIYVGGKPIVASKVDAIPDIIKSGENGILVEPDNAEDVKNEILRLYSDKSFRKNW